MIKKMLFFIPFFLLGVIILYFFEVIGFVYYILGNNHYNNLNYSGALLSHQKSLKYSDDNSVKYNIALDYYKLGDYEKAEKFLLELNDLNNKELLQKKYFGLGNILYFLGKKEENVDKIIEKWEESLSYFQKSLDIEYSKKTKDNYKYVEEQLNKLKEQDEKKKEMSDSGEESNEKSEKEQPNEEEGEKSNDGTSGSGSNGESQSLSGGQGGTSGKEGITQEEKKYLEGYVEYLEEKQKQNQKFFNNEEAGKSFDDIFNSLMGNPFFSNELPGSEEIDW